MGKKTRYELSIRFIGARKLNKLYFTMKSLILAQDER